ncbi:MAG: hypothetical protein IJ646_03255, partial [Clostridia bacterium]|nr:hypothetical protein [Clostridia bacterium]
MKRTLNKWLAALLAACLLLTAPVALMEEAIEAAPEEIVFDLGEVPEAEADLEAEVSDDIEAQADELAPMDLQVLADEAGDELSAEAIPVSDNQWTADGKMIFDFDGGTYTLVKGTSFPLVYADGSTSATGYTSNDGVAVIENNVLKANGLGEAIVSVLTQQGHTYIARFYVENPATPQDVTRPQRVDIMDDSGKVLNGQQLTMKVGDTITLQAKAYYDDHTEGLYLGGNYGQSLKSESLFEDEPGLYRFTAYAPGVASVSVYASGISVTVNIKVVSAAAAQTDGVSIASTFPDEAFRKYITYNYDINEDGFLSASEIEKVYRIDLDKSNGGNIKSVAGIGTFTALDMLSIYDNDYITDVDLNQCANLTEVALGNNKALKSVNASQCKNVLVFSFDNNPSMTTLDVSGCTAVEELVVVGCPLTTLNMGSKPNLVMLELNCDSYLTVNIKQCGKLTAAAGGAYVVMDGDMYTLENENEKYEDISISFRKNVILEGISPKIPSAHDILVSGPDYVRLDGKDVNVQYNAYPIMYWDGGRIYWKISSGAAISEKGLATFSKPGTYTITVSCKYGGKKEYKVTVEGKGAPDPTVPDSITLTAVGYPMTVDPNTQVDSYTVELSAGKVQLKAVCNPSATASQEVTWSFEGPTGYVTIAKDGAVTLKKTGEVMIVATSAKTKTVSKKILLNIVDNSVPKEISITAEGYAKNADGTYTVDVAKPTVKLKAACLPAIAVQTVTWKVTPSSFASITKDGVLTVKKQGEITVVATSTKDKTVTGEVELNIEDHSIPKDIEVTAPGYTKNAEGHYVVDVAKPSVSLKAVCTPDEAVKTVTWKVVPTSFASISKDGVLTLKKQG